MARTRRAFGVFLITTALVAGPTAFMALAKGRGNHGRSVSTLEVVMVDPTDPVANYGDLVTFAVSTTETGRPFVQLSCFQGDDLVLSQSAGFFSGYPFTQSYGLWSAYWTGGAADCTAEMYYFTTNGRERVITTLDFPVAA